MDDSWVHDEFLSADLGDERLNKRLMTISRRFAESPISPINQACEDWNETKAAYRFFRNDNVTYQDITYSHIAAMKERSREYSTVLAIQDTTYFNYSKHPKTEGLCPLSRNKGKHRDDIMTLGLIMHSTFVVGTDGLPLGITDQKIYSRPQSIEKIDAKQRRCRNAKLPIKEKDSYRWVQSLENTYANLAGMQSRVVTICDREADMYDLFFRAEQLNTSLLVRANYDRSVNKRARYSETTGENLWALLKGKKCAAKIRVQIPKQEHQAARIASCEVRFADFIMNVPLNYYENTSKKPTNLNLCAVYVSEIDCPKGREPIDWMLITNIPIKNSEEALEKVSWYCLRWRIETWHKILKSALKVEDCRLSTAERLIRYLAVMSIVAWRILWVTLVARVASHAPCNIFLNEFEWRILAAKFAKTEKDKLHAPTLQQSVMWIAQLGGFLARKADKQPGITHIWRGMKKFNAMLEGAQLASEIYG